MSEFSRLTHDEQRVIGASPRVYANLCRLAMARLNVDPAEFSKLFGEGRLLVKRTDNVDAPPFTFEGVAITEETI